MNWLLRLDQQAVNGGSRRFSGSLQGGQSCRRLGTEADAVQSPATCRQQVVVVALQALRHRDGESSWWVTREPVAVAIPHFLPMAIHCQPLLVLGLRAEFVTVVVTKFPDYKRG